MKFVLFVVSIVSACSLSLNALAYQGAPNQRCVPQKDGFSRRFAIPIENAESCAIQRYNQTFLSKPSIRIFCNIPQYGPVDLAKVYGEESVAKSELEWKLFLGRLCFVRHFSSETAEYYTNSNAR